MLKNFQTQNRIGIGFDNDQIDRLAKQIFKLAHQAQEIFFQIGLVGRKQSHVNVAPRVRPAGGLRAEQHAEIDVARLAPVFKFFVVWIIHRRILVSLLIKAVCGRKVTEKIYKKQEEVICDKWPVSFLRRRDYRAFGVLIQALTGHLLGSYLSISPTPPLSFSFFIPSANKFSSLSPCPFHSRRQSSRHASRRFVCTLPVPSRCHGFSW